MFTRRDFLKWSTSSAAALGLSQTGLFRLQQALAAESSPPLIWLHGASCSGCSIAALNAVSPTTVGDVLLNKVSAKYDALLMAAGADQAIRAMDQAAAAGQFILVVEGGVPVAAGGRYCTIGDRGGRPITLLDAVNDLAPRASRVLAVGTCAAYKGVAGTGANPTGVTPLSTVLQGKTAKPVINVPGCPAPPDQLFKIIVGLLAGGEYALDLDGRPGTCFPHTVHFTCPRKHLPKAKAFGEPGCLLNLGCQGKVTMAMCPKHKWNNGKNWCAQAGHPCIGCAAPEFPASPLTPAGTFI
ncbi:hydrogenase small subunit [Anaeromyxobacter diazotrophicus]|uniref:Iron hydrogenase n=1 Tax=Anaeromyxobacter diazotrophicus TaxID=2590199 RepID=A0A7I9VK38_9BACT|nr:hydrogenase small subunit [Anaeromyxobacter diazotrophicus]GEJ56510.1 iron hydrogenase [Anaeromyxobacter diazotrophicus]